MAKGPDAFRTISEAAEEVGVPQHVLRFWETKFAFIRPMKRAGGRRFYRPTDIATLKGVRGLLHDKGYTIKGVQKLYKTEGAASLGGSSAEPQPALKPAVAASTQPGPSPSPLALRAALDELEQAKAALDAALGRG